jgi:hypothetical protein
VFVCIIIDSLLFYSIGVGLCLRLGRRVGFIVGGILVVVELVVVVDTTPSLDEFRILYSITPVKYRGVRYSSPNKDLVAAP